MKPLDPRTLRETGKRLRKLGRNWGISESMSYGGGLFDAGNVCTDTARAIEKRRAKKARRP